MFEEKNAGIVIIILLFIVGSIGVIIAGIIALAAPMVIVNIANSTPIGGILNALPIIKNIVGVSPINGQPLLGALPGLGVLALIAGVVVIIDVWGLWTEQSWAWVLTVLISLAMIPVVLGIIYLWILFKEDVKMAYGQE
ncbi:MAG: hypothetical protein ACTSO9_02135 [Candidatus Helarchaeota archaeon]